MNYGIIFYKLTGGRLYDSDIRDIISYNPLRRRGPTSNEKNRIRSKECTFFYENQLYYLYVIDSNTKKSVAFCLLPKCEFEL